MVRVVPSAEKRELARGLLGGRPVRARQKGIFRDDQGAVAGEPVRLPLALGSLERPRRAEFPFLAVGRPRLFDGALALRGLELRVDPNSGGDRLLNSLLPWVQSAGRQN